MSNFMTRDREQSELDELMRALGFAVVVAPVATTRPIQPAWYQGSLHGRPVATTLVNRRVVGLNSSVGGGRRNADAVVVSVIMAAVAVSEFGYGIHTQAGVLPDPDPIELVRPEHPAFGMPASVQAAFHRFARGHAGPHESGRSPHARYLRITDRSGIASYLPPVVLPGIEVLVMHEVSVSDGWQATFVPITNELGWFAHALESASAFE